jgi:hypothetical protein
MVARVLVEAEVLVIIIIIITKYFTDLPISNEYVERKKSRLPYEYFLGSSYCSIIWD